LTKKMFFHRSSHFFFLILLLLLFLLQQSTDAASTSPQSKTKPTKSELKQRLEHIRPPPYVWAFKNPLVDELLFLLREEGKAFYKFEFATYQFDDDQGRSTRWIPRSNLDKPSTATELAVYLLSELMKDRLPSTWGGCEWWYQVVSYENEGINFHYDKDETQFTLDHSYSHPLMSSIMYLTDIGGPTLILDQQPALKDPYFEPMTPATGVLSFPEVNKFVIFNGTRLHGVLSSDAHHFSPRITLLINFWEKQPLYPGNLDLPNYKKVLYPNWGGIINRLRNARTLAKHYLPTSLSNLLFGQPPGRLEPFSPEAEAFVKALFADLKSGKKLLTPTEIELPVIDSTVGSITNTEATPISIPMPDRSTDYTEKIPLPSNITSGTHIIRWASPLYDLENVLARKRQRKIKTTKQTPQPKPKPKQ